MQDQILFYFFKAFSNFFFIYYHNRIGLHFTIFRTSEEDQTIYCIKNIGKGKGTGKLMIIYHVKVPRYFKATKEVIRH
jgi:hypothetical protein